MRLQFLSFIIIHVTAKIVSDGLWTGHNVQFVEQNVKVMNGVPSKIVQDGGMHAAWMKNPGIDWENQINVQRV